MRVTYKGRKHRTDATGEYDPESGKLVVKKGEHRFRKHCFISGGTFCQKNEARQY